jgi:hypothetical protein
MVKIQLSDWDERLTFVSMWIILSVNVLRLWKSGIDIFWLFFSDFPSNRKHFIYFHWLSFWYFSGSQVFVPKTICCEIFRRQWHAWFLDTKKKILFKIGDWNDMINRENVSKRLELRSWFFHKSCFMALKQEDVWSDVMWCEWNGTKLW